MGITQTIPSKPSTKLANSAKYGMHIFSFRAFLLGSRPKCIYQNLCGDFIDRGGDE